MIEYEGENMDVEIIPNIPADQHQIVLVTHDESTFYSNDGRKSFWLTKNECVLKKKGPGGSLMVSDFLCACHGPLQISKIRADQLGLSSERARVIIMPGKNKDGWWKSDDMVDQLKKLAIPIFKALHPNCIGLFVFDQSSNHNAYSIDALLAKRMTLNTKEDKVYCFKNGFFYMDGQFIEQPMYFMRNGRPYFKGIKQILLERGLWREGLKLECSHEHTNAVDCCARGILSHQLDFQLQKNAIVEACEFNGCIADFYPKFHCELNFIERYWGYAKRAAREQCDYSMNGLKERVPAILDSVPLATIRKFSRKAWRYMDAYYQGLNAEEAERAVKSFKSHRRIRLND